jgi:hypothetical protein
MNHNIIARAMCKVTNDLLWKPRINWAIKHNSTADLTIRVGSGNKTYVSHKRDSAKNASMTLTYGAKMVADKMDPDRMAIWRTSREVFERKYYGGQLTLLNVLGHTMAHEFGHFVQVILGRRYSGSVHNEEFYTILDRIHASGEGDAIRDALYSECMKHSIDLSLITAGQTGLGRLTGKLPTGEQALKITDIRKDQQLWFLDERLQSVGPVIVREKLRTRVMVESVALPSRVWRAYPAGLSSTPPSAR